MDGWLFCGDSLAGFTGHFSFICSTNLAKVISRWMRWYHLGVHGIGLDFIYKDIQSKYNEKKKYYALNYVHCAHNHKQLKCKKK